MKLVVGLGNPGKKYDHTRHNIGFAVLDQLAKQDPAFNRKNKSDGILGEAMLRNQKVLLLWPQTFMNLSGTCVRAIFDFYKFEIEDVLVVCDDFHIPLGKLRFRPKGSSGGQNGLNHIIKSLGGGDVPRLRVGVGPVPEKWNAADFVLGKFSGSENKEVELVTAHAASAVLCWLENDILTTMNDFN